MEPIDGRMREEKSGFPTAFVLGLGVVLLLVVALLLATHSTQRTPPGRHSHLPFGPAEQAYAENVRIENIKLSESSNLLNQKFTYVSGTIVNAGPRTLAALEITVEFFDPFNQSILRDTHRVITREEQPLGPGAPRTFQITFEHIPVEWNQQNPAIRVTGLILQ